MNLKITLREIKTLGCVLGIYSSNPSPKFERERIKSPTKTEFFLPNLLIVWLWRFANSTDDKPRAQIQYDI